MFAMAIDVPTQRPRFPTKRELVVKPRVVPRAQGARPPLHTAGMAHGGYVRTWRDTIFGRRKKGFHEGKRGRGSGNGDGKLSRFGTADAGGQIVTGRDRAAAVSDLRDVAKCAARR